MPLTIGTRLGHFEIIAPLGAGGMGEVYRARDMRLERDVAIKALPDGFASDAERMARFEREAKLLASLNHPNVAGIHGIEEAGGHLYLVLELVEGESLADRLARGPLPADEAIEVCAQVAAGVEAAHEAGIIHRDLKPGNVMWSSDGKVKVLDFGLAKSGTASGTMSQDANLSASPTMTYAATNAGVILGTAAYMSPEQARGRAVDKRSDVWSFGCVLYECLTARQAFRGETMSDTIAAILKGEADLSALPAATPVSVRALLSRCLCKDARERLRDIGEARVILGKAHAGADAGEVTATAVASSRGRVPTAAAFAGALALALVAAAVTYFATPKPAPAPLRRLDLLADAIGVDWFFAPQLSPDGSKILYLSKGQLWVRDLTQLEAHTLAPVEGMATCAWSPDSKEIAFVNEKKLWRLAVSGGAPSLLCELPGTGKAIGITWSATDGIAFSSWRGGMYTVPAPGGPPRLLIDIDPRQIVDFHAPCWLPNGDLMYVVHWSDHGDSASGHPHDLEVFAHGKHFAIAGAYGDESQALVTRSGRLLFVRRDANAGIWAVDYDLNAHRKLGEPLLVASGARSVSAANDGSLLYVEENDQQTPIELGWVDRSGRFVSSLGSVHPGLDDLAISPDGQKVAFSAVQDGQRDIWVHDIARVVDTRLTFAKTEDTMPHWWGADRLVYGEKATRGQMQTRLMVTNADGSGGAGQLAGDAGSSQQSVQWIAGSPQALRTIDERGHARMRLSALLPDGTLDAPQPFARFTPEPDVGSDALSPNGKLVAYDSNDPQPEVFLTRFPSGEGQWQVSSEGGRGPRWASGTGALYYVAGTGAATRSMVEVKIDYAHDPPVGATTHLFDFDPAWNTNGRSPSFAVNPDGQRFLITRPALQASTRPARMILVQNWEAGLAR
jgi:hypothetical protein